jgi:hypothetical protein
MDDFGVPANPSVPNEGSEDLNGKDATFRNAPMVSAPKLVMKQRIRGALVPMRRVE